MTHSNFEQKIKVLEEIRENVKILSSYFPLSKNLGGYKEALSSAIEVMKKIGAGKTIKQLQQELDRQAEKDLLNIDPSQM